MDRRDLLKFFGIGTQITPMLNGAPIIEATAKLISVPDVAPVEFISEFTDVTVTPHHSRLEWYPYETIFLMMWEIQNRNHQVLRHLLDRCPTQEEKVVAAAMCQWFGTNVGHAFLADTLRTSGYRVTYDESLPNCKGINSLQHFNVWSEFPGGLRAKCDYPDKIVFERHGQRFTVKRKDARPLCPSPSKPPAR